MPKKYISGQKWSIYAKLDEAVQQLLGEDDVQIAFYKNDTDKGCTKDYDTNIMGHFKCTNKLCSSEGWSSMKIAVTIRLYSGNLYNARVYHQRCRDCNSLSRPFLNDSYADRVAYRLKKWSGIQLSPPPFERRQGPPHEAGLCEGCRRGHCSMGQSIFDE